MCSEFFLVECRKIIRLHAAGEQRWIVEFQDVWQLRQVGALRQPSSSGKPSVAASGAGTVQHNKAAPSDRDAWYQRYMIQ